MGGQAKDVGGGPFSGVKDPKEIIATGSSSQKDVVDQSIRFIFVNRGLTIPPRKRIGWSSQGCWRTL